MNLTEKEERAFKNLMTVIERKNEHPKAYELISGYLEMAAADSRNDEVLDRVFCGDEVRFDFGDDDQ